LLSELLAPIAVLLEETKGLKGPGEVKEGEGKTEKGSTAAIQKDLNEYQLAARVVFCPQDHINRV